MYSSNMFVQSSVSPCDLCWKAAPDYNDVLDESRYEDLGGSTGMIEDRFSRLICGTAICDLNNFPGNLQNVSLLHCTIYRSL